VGFKDHLTLLPFLHMYHSIFLGA